MKKTYSVLIAAITFTFAFFSFFLQPSYNLAYGKAKKKSRCYQAAKKSFGLKLRKDITRNRRRFWRLHQKVKKMEVTLASLTTQKKTKTQVQLAELIKSVSVLKTQLQSPQKAQQEESSWWFITWLIPTSKEEGKTYLLGYLLLLALVLLFKAYQKVWNLKLAIKERDTSLWHQQEELNLMKGQAPSSPAPAQGKKRVPSPEQTKQPETEAPSFEVKSDLKSEETSQQKQGLEVVEKRSDKGGVNVEIHFTPTLTNNNTSNPSLNTAIMNGKVPETPYPAHISGLPTASNGEVN